MGSENAQELSRDANDSLRMGSRSRVHRDKPAERIPKPILDDRSLGILSPTQAGTLLEKASEHLPLVAIRLFAGLRRSEVCALDWSEVDVGEKHLEVKGAKSKTRQRRLVTLRPPLGKFLKDRHYESGQSGQSPLITTEKDCQRLLKKQAYNPGPIMLCVIRSALISTLSRRMKTRSLLRWGIPHRWSSAITGRWLSVPIARYTGQSNPWGASDLAHFYGRKPRHPGCESVERECERSREGRSRQSSLWALGSPESIPEGNPTSTKSGFLKRI